LKNGQKAFTNMYPHRYDINCHLHLIITTMDLAEKHTEGLRLGRAIHVWAYITILKLSKF